MANMGHFHLFTIIMSSYQSGFSYVMIELPGAGHNECVHQDEEDVLWDTRFRIRHFSCLPHLPQ